MKGASAVIAALFCGVAAFNRGVHAQNDLKYNKHPTLARTPTYFAVDIDGTFATAQEESMKKNVAAFRMALKTGHTLFFATGRSPASARNLLGRDVYTSIGYNGNPGVYLDGAVVYDDQGRVLQDRPLSPAFLEQLAKVTMDDCHKFMPLFVTADEVLMVCRLPIQAQAVFKAYLSAEDIVMTSVEELKKRKVYNVLVSNINDVFEGIFNTSISSEIGSDIAKNYRLLPLPHGFTQISDSRATKADGIKALLRHYGAEMSDCGCIGDGLNDLEMMEAASLSVAVGNAVPAARESVHLTLKETCDEAAFAKAMQKIYGIAL